MSGGGAPRAGGGGEAVPAGDQTPSPPAADGGYTTAIGGADADAIRLLGRDLAGEMLGSVGFTELAFWLVALRRPSPAELRVFEAVLVALTDHGLTPSVIAARLTLAGAPESLQGAVAAGLLGGGSRFLGVTEDTARFLAEALAAHPGLDEAEAGWEDAAREAVRRCHAAGRRVPGLGHPVHRVADPRTPVILRLAADEGVAGRHLRLFEAVGRVHHEVLGRILPLNGAGACGAALADLGFAADVVRGFALLARTAGLVGHLAEEMRRPLARDIAADVDRRTRHLPSAGP